MIDDDPDDIELFKEALEDASPSTQFISFSHFDSAYQYLSDEMRLVPDLIFLDMNMPIISGLGYLKALKDIPRIVNCKIIIYSTSLHPKQEEEARALNAYRSIKKPTSFQELCDLLRKIFDEIYHEGNSTPVNPID